MATHEGPRRVHFAVNKTLDALPTTVFTKMTNLAIEHGSTNLGQGFPDNELEGPASLKEVAYRHMLSESNQYAPMMGTPALREALGRHSSRYAGLTLEDPLTQTLVGMGATEVLAAAFMGLLNPGDEVVLFAPLYDSYLPLIRLIGARPKIVSLSPPNWEVTKQELERAITADTKLVVVNTPHNPTGKVFTPETLETLASLMERHGVLGVLDEVYEHLVFPGHRHDSLRALPGMAERCVRVGSAGKTFSYTGWKVGWLTGPPVLVAAAAKAHQFLTFSVSPALQAAVAHGLDEEKAFYEGLGGMLAAKRAKLQKRLEAIGFEVLPAQATYFLVADFKPLLEPGSQETDTQFCERITVEAGVTLIPVSAFYDDGPNREAAPKTLVRFVYCKTDERLTAACDKLEAYFAKKQRGGEPRAAHHPLG